MTEYSLKLLSFSPIISTLIIFVQLRVSCYAWFSFLISEKISIKSSSRTTMFAKSKWYEKQHFTFSPSRLLRAWNIGIRSNLAEVGRELIKWGKTYCKVLYMEWKRRKCTLSWCTGLCSMPCQFGILKALTWLTFVERNGQNKQNCMRIVQTSNLQWPSQSDLLKLSQ